MARVMIIGYGPLPQPGLAITHSPSLRTRQILEGARLGGHEISLYMLPLQGAGSAGADRPALIPETRDGLECWRFSSHSGEYAVERLNEELERVRPEAIVGVNTYPSYIAAMLPSPAPLWCDLNGCWMAEVQAKCWAEGEDAALAGAWNIERAILRRLDKFSAVSRPHLHATLGELSGVGRVNRRTFDYPFGARIPHAAFRHEGPAGEDAEPALRGPVVPEGAFVLLWIGGFYPSCDVDALIHALNDLMARHPDAHFVATGGAAPGAEDKTWEGFKLAVEASRHKERYHLLGWVVSERLPGIMREADLGLCIDGKNYETMFGARSRLAVMASEGLAVAGTLGTELSEWLDEGRALVAAPLGDAQSIIDAIAPWIGKREKLKEIGHRARAIMEADFTLEATTEPLRRWLEAPQNAPDNFAKLQLAGKDFTNFHALAINTLEEQAMAQERGGDQPGAAPETGEPLLSRFRKKLLGDKK